MEKDENKVKLFENIKHNNIFKFLVREYYLQSINPFSVLRILSKILSAKISKLLKLKYILFFFSILKKMTLNESIFNLNVFPIINHTIGDVLTRKADYVIIIQYAIFLVQVGEVDLALSRLQILSTDLRFMNNGELIFYRALIHYTTINKECTNSNQDEIRNFISLIEKSLSLIKKNVFLYCEWILRFLINKNLIQEIPNIIKHDKMREYLEKQPIKEMNFLNSLTDSDFIEQSNKILILAQNLKNNFTDFSVLIKFIDLIENYYSEFSEVKSNTKLLFIQKLSNLNESYVLIYIQFLYSYIQFDYLNEDVIRITEHMHKELKYANDKKINFLNKDNMERLRSVMMDNLKIFVEILLRDKIKKKIIETFKKIKKGESEGCTKVIYSKKVIKVENLEETCKKISKVINLIDTCANLVVGNKLFNFKVEENFIFENEKMMRNFLSIINQLKI
jgi:hypothetical protein